MRHSLAVVMMTARLIRVGVISSAGAAGIAVFWVAADSRFPVVEAKGRSCCLPSTAEAAELRRALADARLQGDELRRSLRENEAEVARLEAAMARANIYPVVEAKGS
jgi:hypothetical protein